MHADLSTKSIQALETLYILAEPQISGLSQSYFCFFYIDKVNIYRLHHSHSIVKVPSGYEAIVHSCTNNSNGQWHWAATLKEYFCKQWKPFVPFTTVEYSATTLWTTAIDSMLVILNIHNLGQYTMIIHHVRTFQWMKTNLQQTSNQVAVSVKQNSKSNTSSQ